MRMKVLPLYIYTSRTHDNIIDPQLVLWTIILLLLHSGRKSSFNPKLLWTIRFCISSSWDLNADTFIYYFYDYIYSTFLFATAIPVDGNPGNKTFNSWQALHSEKWNLQPIVPFYLKE